MNFTINDIREGKVYVEKYGLFARAVFLIIDGTQAAYHCFLRYSDNGKWEYSGTYHCELQTLCRWADREATLLEELELDVQNREKNGWCNSPK